MRRELVLLQIGIPDEDGGAGVEQEGDLVQGRRTRTGGTVGISVGVFRQRRRQ
jgi:hypothetical protein